MTRRLTSMSRAVGLLVLAYGAGGCDSRTLPSTSPTLSEPLEPLEVEAIGPSCAVVGRRIDISIIGQGFLPGLTVTLGDIPAEVLVHSGATIKATTPVNTARTVDVVVKNKDGQTAVLAGGFTYVDVGLTTDSQVVVPGGPLSMAWTASSGHPYDWIGLFAAGDDRSVPWSFDGLYDQHQTAGARSGNWRLRAPTWEGEYEFKFALGCNGNDFAKVSAPVTVK